MKAIEVHTPLQNYNIVFEKDFNLLSTYIKQTENNYSRIGIITDSRVAPLYNQVVKASLKDLDTPIDTFIFPEGEAHKNYLTINKIYEFLIEHQFDRHSLLLALGGGVTGDMTGFVAATFMRGIDFIQIPTSLLAQVDSSIGGKTGIDFDGYKNIIGAFYQPRLVYINTETLTTLAKDEFASGMGEAIKHGLILDKDYLIKLEKEHLAIKSLSHKALTDLIRTSCQIKSKIVSKDEKEQGIRAVLNFGHTIGHAIERLKNFTLKHGQCVALGMVASTHISRNLGHLSTKEVAYIEGIIQLFQLPTRTSGLDLEKVYQELFYDKKTHHQQINVVLLKSFGRCYQNKTLSEMEIKKGLKVILK